jgi:hypothetical protein
VNIPNYVSKFGIFCVELANPLRNWLTIKVSNYSTEQKYQSTEYDMTNKFDELFIKDLKKYG